MRDLVILLVHVITIVLRLVRPGGVRGVVAESVLAKHQLLILNRSRQRAPNLRPLDRLIVGICSLWIQPNRLRRAAIAFKPATLLSFHRVLVKRKYRSLFSPKQKTKPGPKGPTADLIRAVVEMKQHNPTWGCPQIADQVNLAFGTSINKDVVRRILAQNYRPMPTEGGPSWLTFIGHVKDSLWSLDLFRCESVVLRTYWVLVVMDQYTRRIIGFGIHAGAVNGEALCRMFNQAIRGASLPKYLSSDHDLTIRCIGFINGRPTFESWALRKLRRYHTLPGPIRSSRLIGTIRREYLDRLLFWPATDLEMKLIAFRNYYNGYRCHAGLNGETPIAKPESRSASLKSYSWQRHCDGLYQTPTAA
jgi:transposase InsO family protein